MLSLHSRSQLKEPDERLQPCPRTVRRSRVRFLPGEFIGCAVSELDGNKGGRTELRLILWVWQERTGSGDGCLGDGCFSEPVFQPRFQPHTSYRGEGGGRGGRTRVWKGSRREKRVGGKGREGKGRLCEGAASAGWFEQWLVKGRCPCHLGDIVVPGVAMQLKLFSGHRVISQPGFRFMRPRCQALPIALMSARQGEARRGAATRDAVG